MMMQKAAKKAEKKGQRRLLREKEVLQRLAVGRTTLDEDFIKTGRLKWVRIGPRIKAAVEDEVDTLIEEIIAEGRETADA
jgi:predicted DNA-binding transcriptional regulator AlpA